MALELQAVGRLNFQVFTPEILTEIVCLFSMSVDLKKEKN